MLRLEVGFCVIFVHRQKEFSYGCKAIPTNVATVVSLTIPGHSWTRSEYHKCSTSNVCRYLFLWRCVFPSNSANHDYAQNGKRRFGPLKHWMDTDSVPRLTRLKVYARSESRKNWLPYFTTPVSFRSLTYFDFKWVFSSPCKIHTFTQRQRSQTPQISWMVCHSLISGVGTKRKTDSDNEMDEFNQHPRRGAGGGKRGRYSPRQKKRIKKPD